MSNFEVTECVLRELQHFWLPTTGKGMQCYSCPSCNQRIYWSETLEKWVRCDPITKEEGSGK